ncbi:unnamed protein product [Trifolium pratense]|uniref:Uncharacterized protein n=1 Tax=Trifolium pratense TaxID=57577 RepID=A0ACB0K548_TRIPR|nr:unnamed protein product [Trifolium pratense]
MRKILQVIELRVSNQAESKESQNHIFKAHEGKYQTEINALENLVVGTTEGNELTPAALDVSGLAVKCLAPLVRKMNEPRVVEMSSQLCDKILNVKDQHRDTASIALKTVVAEC